MEELPVEDEQQLRLNSKPEKQVFSNALLLDIIWKHLESQDLIRASLVSKKWLVKSREKIIKDKNNKYPVCIQIDGNNPCPCRALVKFNKFLQYDYGSNEYPIVFNGIQVVLKNPLKHTGEKCISYSKQDPLYEVLHCGGGDGRWNQNSWDEQIRNIPKVFEKILDTIKFQYIRLENYKYNQLCPFSKFLHSMITRNAENILELKINEDSDTNRLVHDFLRLKDGCLKFRNLQIFSISEMNCPNVWSGLQTIVPSLKRINRFQLNLSNILWDSVQDFPFHAIVNLGNPEGDEETAKATVEFIKKYEPKIESVSFDQSADDNESIQVNNEALQEDLFQIGRLVSDSLTTLTCSPLFLSFLASRFDTLGFSWSKNLFPVLNTLNLLGFIGEKALEFFGMEEFGEIFPTLWKIRLNFGHLKPNLEDPRVYCSYNSAFGTRSVRSVKCLVLEASQIDPGGSQFLHNGSMESVSRWLNLFGFISHLDLTGMPFKYDGDDRDLSEILSIIWNLPFSELTIGSADLTSFSLDFLFKENTPKVSDHWVQNDFDFPFYYRTSLLDSKSLRQITIYGKEICNTYRNAIDGTRCYSRQLPGTFLVSSRTAQLMRRELPGFKFSLIIKGEGKCCCSGVFRPGGFRFEHLEPHARISFREIYSNERHWEVEFLSLMGEYI